MHIPDEAYERRLAERKALRTRVLVAIPEKPLLEGRAIDISLSGIGLVLPVNLNASMLCDLGFNLLLKDNQKVDLKIRGTISYSVFSAELEGFKLGVRFHGLTEETAKAISKYMRR